MFLSIFFSATLGIRIFFLEIKHTPPNYDKTEKLKKKKYHCRSSSKIKMKKRWRQL
jgi:hypothetical protein